ncbi:hypothetical protein [Streptomyces sp. NPDC059909]|uniref:hypothetical protein n=1 Tax=Streptomyces sp. NPDC059909 TaxID=3346998 RepID=UPI003647D6EA
MERTGTTRRRALMATGAVAASTMGAGCSSEAPAERQGRAPGPVSAETALRRRSTTASRALLARYDAVLIAHPGLVARLTPLRDAVARHVEALAPVEPGAGASASAAAGAPAAASAAPSPSASATTAAPPVPADADAAVRELAAAERSTADAHTIALVHAPPEYARLLASVAAAGAVHTYLLTKGARS